MDAGVPPPLPSRSARLNARESGNYSAEKVRLLPWVAFDIPTHHMFLNQFLSFSPSKLFGKVRGKGNCPCINTSKNLSTDIYLRGILYCITIMPIIHFGHLNKAQSMAMPYRTRETYLNGDTFFSSYFFFQTFLMRNILLE